MTEPSYELVDDPARVEELLGRSPRSGERAMIRRWEKGGEELVWAIELTKYHRDNLLWLMNVIGYPRQEERVDPFNLANTGDWNGEIPIWLGYVLDPADHPNITIEELRRRVTQWLADTPRCRHRWRVVTNDKWGIYQRCSNCGAGRRLHA